MNYLSKNHRRGLDHQTLASWKGMGLLAVITAILFLIPGFALAQVPVVDAGPDQTIYLGDTAMLHATATGDPIGWQWEVISAPAGSSYILLDADSGDALFSTDTWGAYVITVMALNYSGWSDPDALVVRVVQNQPPTAIASASPLSGTAPLDVTFDGTLSFDPEGGALLYDWTFGDGTYSSEATPVHTFDLPGVYSVSLVVVDERGAADFDIIEITVTAANLPPVAAPTATPNNGPEPLVVQFAANASDPDSTYLTYLWDFGDPGSSDNTSTLADPQHVYEAAGTYVAWLDVSDGVNTVSESVTVVVSSAPLLSTSRASIVAWDTGQNNKGTISYWGDIDLPMPAADEVISFAFDGLRLFQKRFSQFEPSLNASNEYVFVQRWLLVRINFDTNTIYVEAQKENINKLDHSDGIDVELMWGDDTAVDQFMMTQDSDMVWTYVRDE
jgi:PKD repeat protein